MSLVTENVRVETPPDVKIGERIIGHLTSDVIKYLEMNYEGGTFK